MKDSRHPLAQLRDAIDITQQKLGDEIGRSRSFINQIESGAEPIGRDTVLLVFDHFRPALTKLRLTVEDFLRWQRAE